MKSKLGRGQLRRGLKNSIREGIAGGAASGIIGTYLTPFALALGAGAAQIGLLSALPQLLSTILQPLAGTIAEHAESRKRVCKIFLIISRIAMFPVLLLGFLRGFDTVSLLLFFVSVSAAAASFARPAWASWIGGIVPEKKRGAFFGRRNMFIGASSFIAALSAGWVLGYSDTIAGFILIFLAAFILHNVGLKYLLKVPEVQVRHKVCRHNPSLNISEFLSSLKKANFRRFVVFAMFFNFSVYLSSPFFAIYKINELQIGYWWFAVVSSISMLAGMLSQRYWGKISDKYGDKNVMMICAAFVSLIPLIFVFSRSVPLLALASIFSGFAWAGLDLVTFNFLLDSSPPMKRPLFISGYQFFSGLAVAGGSVAGGYLIHSMGDGIAWLSAISIIFLFSFVLRGVSILLIPGIKEERIKSRKVLPVRGVFMRAVVLYPARGISHEIEHVHHCLACWEQKAKKEMKGVTKMLSVG